MKKKTLFWILISLLSSVIINSVQIFSEEAFFKWYIFIPTLLITLIISYWLSYMSTLYAFLKLLVIIGICVYTYFYHGENLFFWIGLMPILLVVLSFMSGFKVEFKENKKSTSV